MSRTVSETNIPGMQPIHRGKVRDTYSVRSGGRSLLLVVSSDRVSAFDKVLPNPIPGKGQVLNSMSLYWSEWMLYFCPNHVFSGDEQLCASVVPVRARGNGNLFGRSMLVHPLKMLPVECVVRGFLAGSAWGAYQKGEPICGITLPPGLSEADELPAPLFTPTTKAQTGHDQPLTFDELVEIVGPHIADQLRYYSLLLYRKAKEVALAKGIILADTKFEFGINEGGRVFLADEILTPDSSRFWDASAYRPGKTPPSFDKQPLRDFLRAQGWTGEGPAPELPPEVVKATSARYIEAHKRLVGEPLPF